MSIKQDVPEKLESLLVEALSDDAKVGTELECFQLRAVQPRGPIRQPLGRLSRVFDCVPQRSHQVRLALTAAAQQHNRSRFVRLRGLEDPQEVNGWVGNVQKFDGRLLEGTRRLVCGEVDGGALESFPSKFLPQS